MRAGSVLMAMISRVSEERGSVVALGPECEVFPLDEVLEEVGEPDENGLVLVSRRLTALGLGGAGQCLKRPLVGWIVLRLIVGVACPGSESVLGEGSPCPPDPGRSCSLVDGAMGAENEPVEGGACSGGML